MDDARSEPHKVGMFYSGTCFLCWIRTIQILHDVSQREIKHLVDLSVDDLPDSWFIAVQILGQLLVRIFVMYDYSSITRSLQR